MIKAIIMDLDGTLLHSDRTISGYTVDILNRCREKGIHILAATARPERTITAYRRQVPFDAVTTLNGAKIILHNRCVENAIPYDCGEKMLAKLLETPGVLVSVETSDGLYSSVDKPEWNAACFSGFPKLPTEGALYKILVSSDEKLSMEQVKSVLTEDVYCTTANANLFQIMSRAATKWNGICVMLESLGISAKEAVYFGDDYDDLEPIINCGMGVAMANANQDVLSAARYTALSNNEDGVARFIEERILTGKD